MSEHRKLGEVPTFTSDIEPLVRDQFPQTVDVNGRLRDHPTLMILDSQSVMRKAQAWSNENLRTAYNLSVETEELVVALEKKINTALWWFVGICGASIITGIVMWNVK